MLEYIRTHQRVAQIMLGLVALALLLSGVGSWDWVSRDANAVASVAGQSIGQQEWENTQREQTDRFRRMMGARFDPKMLESPEMKQRMLDSLVERRVLDIEAKQRLLTIGEQALQEEIVNTPDFHGADGKFDKEAYITRLAMAGISPLIHQAQLRESKMLGQFNSGIAGSAFAPRTVANRLSDINDEEREAQEILIKASDYTDKVKITDEMVKDYYNKNGKKFELPEQVKIDYVLLNNDVAAAQLTIADADAKAFYEKNVKRFTEEEQRRASHILVKLAKDASSADKTAAKTKAEKLLAQVRANKADFAKLAKENSDDPGSAAQGVDLDFFVFGSMVKPFAEATFKLKKDEISDLVLSDFGYHIILLTDVKPSKQKTFDEVKSEILAEMRRDQVAKKFSELTEVFNNAVDENGEGLKAIAENPKLKLKIESVTDVTRQGNMTLGPQSPVNNPKFLKALFASQEVLKGKRNSDVVPVEQNTLIAAHVTEYKPAKVRPLEEVQPAIKDFLLKKEASELAKKDGLAKVAALKAKDDVTGFGEGKVVSRSKQPAMSAIAAQEVLKADVSKLPAFVGVELPGMGYAVYRIGKVSQSATPDAARRKTEQEQIAGIYSQQDFYAAMEWMKQKHKVSINKKAANIVPAASEASASASAK